MKAEEAVRQAVDECISEGILAEFFKENREEIVEMGIYEFNQEVYDEVLREDGEARGIEIGRSQGIEIGKGQGIEIGRRHRKFDGYAAFNGATGDGSAEDSGE